MMKSQASVSQTSSVLIIFLLFLEEMIDRRTGGTNDFYVIQGI